MSTVKDLNASFTTMRNVALACVLGLIVVVVGSGFMVYRTNENAGRRVYVVSANGSAAALALKEDVHTSFEARNLVKSFMQTMFGHDQYTFKQHLDAALPLIEGRGGRRIFEGFTQGQVLQNYQRYSARNVVDVDSIQLNMERRPYSGVVYTKQRIFIGDQQREALPLAAKFNLIETDRSNANPYGLLLTNFDYVAYNPPTSREEKDALEQQEQDRQRRLKEAAAAPAEPGLNPATGPAPLVPAPAVHKR